MAVFNSAIHCFLQDLLFVLHISSSPKGLLSLPYIHPTPPLRYSPVQLPGWYRVWLLFSLHISSYPYTNHPTHPLRYSPVQLPGWYRVWLLFSLHKSSSKKHLFLKVVALDEHTCSSYSGQSSTQTQRASNGAKALHTAK